MREKICIALGLVMAVALFWAGGEPAAGEAVSGAWHYAAHLIAFAILAGLWTLGLPKAPATYIALAVVAFGFLHEAYEIIGHAHGFELIDALVDGAGAIAGTIAARYGRRLMP